MRQHLVSVITMGNAALESLHIKLDWDRLQSTARIIMEKATQMFVMSSFQLCNKGMQVIVDEMQGIELVLFKCVEFLGHICDKK